MVGRAEERREGGGGLSDYFYCVVTLTVWSSPSIQSGRIMFKFFLYQNCPEKSNLNYLHLQENNVKKYFHAFYGLKKRPLFVDTHAPNSSM